MKKIVLSLVLVLGSVGADTKADMTKCAKKNDLYRLICYDDIAKKLGIKKPKAEKNETKNKGNWIVKESKSEIDDSVNVYLVLEANNRIKTRYRQYVTPEMYIRCQENSTSMFISWDTYLGLRETTVLTRLDKNKAKYESWGISTDTKGTFAPKAISLSKQMMKHKKLLVGVTPYNENPVTITFDISGLEEAIKPLRKACGW